MRYINENNWYGGNIVSNEQYNKTLNDIEKTGKINIESIEDSLEHPKIIGNPHKTKALDIEINSISGITSDNVQEALDEIIGITNSTFRPIAEDISINPISGMTSDNTQEALNEIYNNTIRLETDLNLDGYTVAEALNLLYSKIIALEKLIADGVLGNVQVDSITTIGDIKYKGASIILLGTAAPSIAPDFEGQTFINTTSPGTVYTAKGVSGVSDWKQTSN